MDRDEIEKHLARRRDELAGKCSSCDGSGEDEDGEKCFSCKGTGKQTPFCPRLVEEVKRLPGWDGKSGWRGDRIGSPVSIRPCDRELGKKTYLGFYLGDLAIDASIWAEGGTLVVAPYTNPAIWVPDLGRIVWGYESWWGIIGSPEELREITDADINSLWYVQALKAMCECKEEQGGWSTTYA